MAAYNARTQRSASLQMLLDPAIKSQDDNQVFILCIAGDRVENNLQLAVDSCQKPVSVAKLEYRSIGFQTVDRGLTIVDCSSCLMYPVSCILIF
jgi:hypothetical protein